MPNSLKLVFVTDEASTVGNFSLYIANNDGTNRVKLNVNAPGDGVVNTKFEISSSGRIVYPSKATGSANEWIMSSVLSDTTGYRRLSALTGNINRSVQQDSFLITPNGLKVVYLSTAAGPLPNSAYPKEIYSIDIDAVYPTSETKISGAMAHNNGNVDGVTGVMFKSTPDSSKIVFAGDLLVDNVKELFAVGINSTSPTKLNATLVSGGNVSSFKIADNSQDILYGADGEVDGVNELFHVNTLSLVALKINSSLISGENVVDYQIDSSSGKAVYMHNKGGIYNLYSKNFSGGTELKLNTPSALSIYDVLSPKKEQFVMSGSKVFFRGALEDSTMDLYSVDTDGANLKRAHRKNHAQDVIIADQDQGRNFEVVGSYVVYRVLQMGQKVLYSSKY
jgi:hypothetical protein